MIHCSCGPLEDPRFDEIKCPACYGHDPECEWCDDGMMTDEMLEDWRANNHDH